MPSFQDVSGLAGSPFRSAAYPRTSLMALLTHLRRIGNALPLRGPLTKDPTAQILHSLAVGLVGWLTLEFAIDLPFVTPRKIVGAAWLIFALLYVVAVLAVLHRGKLRAASLVYLSGNWLLFTV